MIYPSEHTGAFRFAGMINGDASHSFSVTQISRIRTIFGIFACSVKMIRQRESIDYKNRPRHIQKHFTWTALHTADIINISICAWPGSLLKRLDVIYGPFGGRRDTTGTMRIDDIENTVFTVINEQGEETECDVLLTFDSEETGKSYIIYTDNTLDENGNIKVYVS